MLLVIVYLLSTLLAPRPLVSVVVDAQPHSDHLDVVVYVLNSDPRYTDFVIAIDGVSTPISAPVSELQTITTTLPLDVPLLCGAQRAYSIVVSARVFTDTATFARTEVGGFAARACPYRIHLPI